MDQSLTEHLLQEMVPDGSLRDIYVEDTDSKDWHNLLGMLKSSELNVEFSEPFDEVGYFNVQDALRHVSENGPVFLNIKLDQGLKLVCHFFTLDEIEMDISPNEVRTIESMRLVQSFIERVSNCLKKPVLLCYENFKEKPIAQCTEGEWEIIAP